MDHYTFALIEPMIGLSMRFHLNTPSFFVLAIAVLICVPSQLTAQVTHTISAGESIQSAIDAAASGDTILVNAGTYTENLVFGAKELSLRSVSGARATTIASFGEGTAVELSGASQLVGFTITGANPNVFDGGGIRISGDGTVIQGNIFERNGHAIGEFGAAIGGDNASPIIVQNIFRENVTGSLLTLDRAGVVTFTNDSSPTIFNNVFASNFGRALNLTLSAGTSPRVINNTFWNNDSAFLFDGFSDEIDEEFRNNIITAGFFGFETRPGSGIPDWQNNLVFGNVEFSLTDTLVGINGNITGIPGFVNGVGEDYRLLEGSIAIDAGSSVNAPLFDFDNNVRPFDGNGDGVARVDIGAFEFTAVPEPAAATVLWGIGLILSTVRRRRLGTPKWR